MNDPRWLSAVLHLLSAVSWPIAILVLAFAFRKSLRTLVERVHTLKAGSTGLELVLNKLEKEGLLPAPSRAELAGLSPHDIWALNDFAEKKVMINVDRMNPPQRVAARTLIDLNLLTVIGEAQNRQVTPTPLGLQILAAAKSLTL